MLRSNSGENDQMASRSDDRCAAAGRQANPAKTFIGSDSHSPMKTRRQRNQDAAHQSHQAAADDAHQDRAFERNIGGVEVVHRPPHQYTQSKRDADDEHDLELLAQRAFFAEQQHAETPRAHQHAADGRGHAEPDQQSDENEASNPISTL